MIKLTIIIMLFSASNSEKDIVKSLNISVNFSRLIPTIKLSEIIFNI